MELAGKTVLVLGLGDTGLSMARWLARRGARLRLADSREDPPHAATLARELPQVPIHLGPFRDELFTRVDLIAISPGVPLAEPHVARARAVGIPVVGDVELFALHRPREHTRLIAITGSNGKSTVTALAGAMCRGAGLSTVVAGNIGLPVLTALTAIEEGEPAPGVFVLELSSFQLETTFSLDADAATVLNLSQDHLDRYASMADYAAAKARIFQGHGVQVLNRD
ncbi:MAG: Mur ligase family protein, partial [Burkholderiales bacterium]